VSVEYVDAGVSGAKNTRPALDELVAATMAGEVDVVVIAKLDRLGRSLLHLLTLIGQLDALGIRGDFGVGQHRHQDPGRADDASAARRVRRVRTRAHQRTIS
jgi:hypothetical protein